LEGDKPMSPRTIALTDPLHDYLLTHGVREPAILTRLRQATVALGRPAGMQIAPEQGQFMALLVETLGAGAILEIGTFTGYSALVMALAQPPGGRIVTCDTSPQWTELARQFWIEAGVADRIDLRLGPARDSLDALLAQGRADSFDIAFIDADKTSYGDYYEACVRLVRPGGLILVDNVLWSGRVADPTNQEADTIALRRLNARLHDDDRVTLAMVPIGDGLTMARRRPA
jgi:predicted O-methyltransferase YrrM